MKGHRLTSYRSKLKFITVCLGACSALACSKPMAHYDVVVYGGSAAGAMAAIHAAKEGASVVLLEPRQHIGGLVSGGLGATDFGNKNVIGGASREFFERAGKHYGQKIAWYFEPHVAEQILRDWLKDAGVNVQFDQPLARVTREGKKISAIQMKNGDRFAGKIFLDCSYEGDLMARTGVSYTWGREGQSQYGESLAGVREWCKYHQFDVSVDGRDSRGRCLPGVHPGERGEVGQADRKVQAYNFRICMCNRKENQVPFPKPRGYDPDRYEILRRYLDAKRDTIKLSQLMHIVMMPNGKTDVNNNGPISTDHIGGSWEYPEANEAQRRRIWQDHVNYVQGFFYFLANDPSVPPSVQKELNTWGLAKDEFVDTGHWPHQMYVREARRMVGEFVVTQKDLQTERTKPDSIGMGSYNSDSHHVQRNLRPDGSMENEGDMQVSVKPYEIPYRALLPKADECENLLVPVCFSASHVAYSSMRMEPQYMIIGQAAGLAAATAAKNQQAVQAISVPELQEKLRAGKAILTMPPAR